MAKKSKSRRRRRKSARRKSNPTVAANPRRKRARKSKTTRRRRRRNPGVSASANPRRRKGIRRRRRNPSMPPAVKAALAAGTAAVVATVGGALVNRFIPSFAMRQGAMGVLALASTAFASKSPVYGAAMATAFALPAVANLVGPTVDKVVGAGMGAITGGATPTSRQLAAVSTEDFDQRLGAIMANGQRSMVGMGAIDSGWSSSPIY